MSEIKVVRKLFFVWNFEKEERWLNEMAMEGWTLKKVGFFKYTFEKTADEYEIRLGMIGIPNTAQLSTLKEEKVEYIGNILQWAYFRKKVADGDFELFSDLDSKIQHMKNIAYLLAVLGAVNLFYGFMLFINGSRGSIANLLAVTLLMYALGRIHGKKDELEKERDIHE